MHSTRGGGALGLSLLAPDWLSSRLLHRAVPCLMLAAAFMAGTVASAIADEKVKVHTVLIDGMKFSPQTLEVNAGDTVVWRNKDPYPHTATAENKAFDSGDIPENGTWKYVAKTKGTMAYFCKLHTTMKGVLVVK
ncbi:MAG: copper-binding protein [Herminiimonas sp.]|nr:copper-binding protein [Herminiimonas sp.]MDB5852386.1 copper-binding protein [Herminiimonas sp.]